MLLFFYLGVLLVSNGVANHIIGYQQYLKTFSELLFTTLLWMHVLRKVHYYTNAFSYGQLLQYLLIIIHV